MNRLLLILLLYSFDGWGQEPKKNIPQGYFMFPIRPSELNFLSGNMGDLRKNHFHAGIDIKTQAREGLPVFAAAQGYVSRIRVMTHGYGNVLYIKHPNGYTTVYGHLKEFSGNIGKYVLQKQYEDRSWEIDINLSSDDLPVNQADIVALSGNSGGSGGPHLHFEIRDQLDNVYNPLLFGFSEIQDNISPIFQQIALSTFNQDSHINDTQKRQVFNAVKQKNGNWDILEPIKAFGELSLELLAYDLADKSPNQLGINTIQVILDGTEVFYSNLDFFPNELSRDINVHINYAIEQVFNKNFQKCYIDEGNRLPIYRSNNLQGKIVIENDKIHDIEIIIADVKQNQSTLRFRIIGKKQENLTSVEASETYQNWHINQTTAIVSGNIRVEPQANSIYAAIFLKTKEIGKQIEVGSTDIPVKDNVKIAWKYPFLLDNIEKSHVYLVGNKNKRLESVRNGNDFSFQSREFGTFAVKTDVEPPSIKLVSKSPENVRFFVRDNLSGIASWDAYHNGNWLLLHYDYKSGILSSQLSSNRIKLEGIIRLTLIDYANNSSFLEVDMSQPLPAKIQAKKYIKHKKVARVSRKNKKRLK